MTGGFEHSQGAGDDRVDVRIHLLCVRRLVLLGAAVVGCRNWIRFRDSERAELRHRAWVSLAAAAVCFVLAAVAVRVLLRYGFN